MANGRAATVLYVDTTGYSNTDNMFICGVKYIGASSGTAAIYNKSSGQLLWEASGSSNEFNHVEFHSVEGIYVAVTNSAKVYIYIDPDA